MSISTLTSNFQSSNFYNINVFQIPGVEKVVKVMAMILGLGLLASLPSALPIVGVFPAVGLAITGVILFVCSAASLSSYFASPIVKLSYIGSKGSEGIPTENAFMKVSSRDLKTYSKAFNPTNPRSSFMNEETKSFPPVFIACSHFVGKGMVEHLMRHKKDGLLEGGYRHGDDITPMEATLHLFVTPITPVLVANDLDSIEGSSFGNSQVRSILLSDTPSLGLNFKSLVLPLVSIKANAFQGALLPEDYEIPSREEKTKHSILKAHEGALKKHVVYHLMRDHKIPASKEVLSRQIFSSSEAISRLNEIIRQGVVKNPLIIRDKFIFLESGQLVSLGAILNIYKQQLLAEISLLNKHTPQKYIYTMDHFYGEKSSTLVDPKILSLLHLLAFKEVYNEHSEIFVHFLGARFMQNSELSVLFRNGLPSLSLLDEWEEGSLPEDFALVMHRDNDVFRQTIETKGGRLEKYSNAAALLKRDREDLLDHVCFFD